MQVDPATRLGLRRIDHADSVPGDDPQQVRLRRSYATSRAHPDWPGHNPDATAVRPPARSPGRAGRPDGCVSHRARNNGPVLGEIRRVSHRATTDASPQVVHSYPQVALDFVAPGLSAYPGSAHDIACSRPKFLQPATTVLPGGCPRGRHRPERPPWPALPQGDLRPQRRGLGADHHSPARRGSRPRLGTEHLRQPLHRRRAVGRDRCETSPTGPRGQVDGGGVGAVSDRMSIRQPVSRAASRAFWPSRPMARESW
jgi:hypothetical protein